MGGFQTPTQESGNKSKEVSSRHKNSSNENLKKQEARTLSFVHPETPRVRAQEGRVSARREQRSL